MVASATYVQTAELLFYLMQYGYQDVVYFDTFPVRGDPVQECAANMMSVESICNRLDSLDRRVLAEAQAAQDALAVRRVLYEALFR
jgi:xylose isomerase